MSPSDDAISRRSFLDKTARRGLALSAAGSIAAASEVRAAKTAETPQHRYIDQDLCVGCRLCVPLCPMGAIGMASKKASIDANECAECGTCSRSKICPVDAIETVKLEWPRELRETFSNPMATHKGTGVAGRGTEGIKTNDTQNSYGQDDMGILLELGRPVLGARFSDVEKVVMKFKAHGYEVHAHNPIASLVADPATGALKPEILNEKIISCVVEFKLPVTAAGELTAMAQELTGEVESVFNLSVALRADDAGKPRFDAFFPPDVFRLPNGKANTGMALGIQAKEASL